MKYALFRDLKPFGKLVLTFFLMGSSYLVVFILTTLVAIPIYGISLSEIIEIFRTGCGVIVESDGAEVSGVAVLESEVPVNT